MHFLPLTAAFFREELIDLHVGPMNNADRAAQLTPKAILLLIIARRRPRFCCNDLCASVAVCFNQCVSALTLFVIGSDPTDVGSLGDESSWVRRVTG